MRRFRGFERQSDRVVALLFAVGAFAVGLAPSSDGDLWWHLAAGREMWRTHALLHTDPFSVSAAGRPWVDVHWLFQLLVYAGYSLGGLRALVLAKCAIVAVGATLLLATVAARAGRRTVPLFATVFLVGLFLVRDLLLVRPVIPTLAFLGLFFFVLERQRALGRSWLLVVLPLTQIVWANVQGLSALGPALVLAYAVGAFASSRFGHRPWFPFAREVAPGDATGWQRLGLATLLCAVASTVTPFGLAAVTLPIRLLGRLDPASRNVFSANIAENVPPLELARVASGQFGHLSWFLALYLLGFLLPGRGRSLSRLLVTLGLSGLALAANRNVLLLYWLAIPAWALNAAPSVRRLLWSAKRYLPRRRLLWSGPLAVLAALVPIATAAARESRLNEPAPFRTPRESARIIAEQPDELPVFAADHFGGYLIWALHPRHRPYLDTRLILRTADEYAEFLGLLDFPERFATFAERLNIGYVVLPTAYPDRYFRLITHLYASRTWKLVFTNGSETLFARRQAPADAGWDLSSPALTERVLRAQAEEFAQRPDVLTRARLELAKLELAVGAWDSAEQVLAPMPGPEAEMLKARGKLARGDVQASRAFGEAALERDSEDTGALNLLALSALAEGKRKDAVNWLRQALHADPFNLEATDILRQLEEHEHATTH